MLSDPTPVVNLGAGYSGDRWSVGGKGSFSKDEQAFELIGGIKF